MVLSVGGSILAPAGGVDVKFVRAFKDMIERHVQRGWRFVIVVGGGAVARSYQQAANDIGVLTRDDLDWIGIHATRLNAHLLRTIFRRRAHPVVIKDPTRVPSSWEEPILIGAGWKPGWSTDYVAVRLAKRLGADTVINLSNIDYLYTADPKTHPDAEPICEIDWKTFRKMVGSKWSPGLSAPFDPVASKLAQSTHTRVVLANGTKMENLDNLLSGKKFFGTIIS